MASRSNSSNNSNTATTIGPDLNASRSLLDEKLYRQILLSNGLRAILVSDVPALKKINKNNTKSVGNNDNDEEDGDNIDDHDVLVEVSDNDMGSDSSSDKNNDDHKSDDEEEEECDDDSYGDEEEEDDMSPEEENGDEEGGERRAAAAILLGAGSYHEPRNIPGLAHFLEHMVFMGNKKYPTENEFDEFLSKHGGDNNAFTEQEYTLYHFEIIQEYLMEALDRMANFFINPILSPNAVDRELNAIESEFQLSKNNDGCRYQEVL